MDEERPVARIHLHRTTNKIVTYTPAPYKMQANTVRIFEWWKTIHTFDNSHFFLIFKYSITRLHLTPP